MGRAPLDMAGYPDSQTSGLVGHQRWRRMEVGVGGSLVKHGGENERKLGGNVEGHKAARTRKERWIVFMNACVSVCL